MNEVNRRMEAKPREADGFSEEISFFATPLRSLRLCGVFLKMLSLFFKNT